MNIKNPYESDELLQQYLVFHYANAEEQFPYSFGGADALDFPRRCALQGADLSKLAAGARALDLGCSVGRSSFELARHCEEVIGIDYSQAFIDAANRIVAEGVHPATRLDEGSATTQLIVSVDPAIDRSRLSFEQGDAQCIRTDIGQFDLVIACNLVCRLPELGLAGDSEQAVPRLLGFQRRESRGRGRHFESSLSCALVLVRPRLVPSRLPGAPSPQKTPGSQRNRTTSNSRKSKQILSNCKC